VSAYVVSNNTIHAIVRGGLQYGLVKRATAGLIGQALIETNHWSLCARYVGDQMPAPMTGYHLPDTIGKLTPEAIVGCIQCFEYQACEFEDWTHSAAYRFTQALLQRIERSNPGIMERYRTVGTEARRAAYPWGIEGVGIEAFAPYLQVEA